MSPYTSNTRSKTYTLQSSHEVRLFGPEIAVVDTPEFQRLAGVKQLGTSNYVFRSAIHTRFEHSLGTLHMAEQLVQVLRANGSPVPEPARRLARLAALLHDLPHIPFGHTLEDEFQLLTRHDEDEVRWDQLLVKSRIGEVLRDPENGIGEEEFDELHRVVTAKDEKAVRDLRYPFVADIVGNTVCADLLDYITRDLEAAGMPVALGSRFLSYLVITPERPVIDDVDSSRMALRLDKRGMPRPDVVSEVIKLLTYRYELAERVYFHHAKNAASVMIGRAAQELGLAGGEANDQALGLLWSSDGLPISDDFLLHLLAEPKLADVLGMAVEQDVASRRVAAHLGRAVLNRTLYKVAYLGVHEDIGHRRERVLEDHGKPSKRRELEDRLAKELDLEPGQVLIHLPLKMMMKAAAVRVLQPDARVTTLEHWEAHRSDRVRALNDAHDRLWRVMVFVHPDQPLNVRRLAAAKAGDIFGPRSRYVFEEEPEVLPPGWRDSVPIASLSLYQEELALQEALSGGYSTAEVEAAIPVVMAGAKGYGRGSLELDRAAWHAGMAGSRHLASAPESSPQLDLEKT